MVQQVFVQECLEEGKKNMYEENDNSSFITIAAFAT